jgi:protein gp37
LVVWGGERRRTSAGSWRLPLKWNAQAEREGRRFRVFCASLADVFDKDVPAEWRDDLWRLIESTPNLDWLLLTKRVGNVVHQVWPRWMQAGWPANVWIGATVCNQSEADRDIPKLLEVPARVRFLSIEPMLGPIDLTRVCITNNTTLGRYADCLRGHLWDESAYTGGGAPMRNDPPDTSRIDWVIAGGESGPKARPSHPDWFRSLRDQCAAAGVAYLHKQNGEWVSVSEVAGPGAHYTFQDGATVRRTGKKLAGRTIDGIIHDAYPEVQP